MADGMLWQNSAGQWALVIDNTRVPVGDLPYGNNLILELVNGLVTRISFVGQEVRYIEIRGIVVENNPDFGYITVINNGGDRQTFRYFENDMRVRKLQYFDNSGGLRYLSHMFPNFTYDPSLARISDIEPGDIVFIRADNRDEPDVITEISAATNYAMRHGKIRQINRSGDVTQILIEHENGQTAWFNVTGNIFVTKQSRVINLSQLMVGDWVKLLVNEAVIGAGHVIRSVKEITVEGGEFLISNIVRGELVQVNSIQNQLVLQNTYSLSKTGWTGHRNLSTFNVNINNIEYYRNGDRISLAEAQRFMQRNSGYTAYAALENFPGGERIRKITFRDEREELLPTDTVFTATGTGTFNIMGYDLAILADSGTIVRRHGRLVNPRDILAFDYLTVVLTGGSAAVVDIVAVPDTSRVVITRARVARVNEGVSFTAQSIAQLSGTEWLYSPIEREFTIDHNTLFLNESGFVDPSTFTDILETSVIDRVFNVVTDGTKATYVVAAPYADRALRGTVYSIQGSTAVLRDVHVLNMTTNVWTPVADVNNHITLNIEANTIIAKDNEVVRQNALVAGDQLLIMTNDVPAGITRGSEITGYIILVEK
jgi:hypothetical protein